MPTFFQPEPDGPEISRVELAADRGTDSEDTVSTQVVETVEPSNDRIVQDVRKAVSLPNSLDLFQRPDAHPFVLDVALMRKYGPEWLIWEPEYLEKLILKDFHSDLSDLNMDKLQAIRTVHLVDTFWETWMVFSPCVSALSGIHADFRVLSAPTVPQVMVAVDIVTMIRADTEYSDEVKKYMEAVFLHDGIMCPTEPLSEFFTVDTSRYSVDCAKVMREWPAVRDSGKAPEEFTAENVQLQRMLDAHEALMDSRKQSEEQLKLIY